MSRGVIDCLREVVDSSSVLTGADIARAFFQT